MTVYPKIAFLVATVVGLAATGCASLGGEPHLQRRNRGEEAEIVGTVQTGGQYAATQTTPITTAGLTLGNALQQTLRPAVNELRRAAMSNTIAPTMRTAAENAANDKTGLIRSAVQKLSDNTGAQGMKSALDTILSIAEARGNDELQDQLLVLIKKANRDFSGAMPPPRAVEENFAAIVTALEASGVSLAAKSNTEQVAASGAAQDYFNLAVVLIRSSGERIALPLWLAEHSAGGDIALKDGDQVRVLPFRSLGIFESNSEANGQGVVFIKGLTPAVGARANTQTLGQIVDEITNENSRISQVVDLVVLTRADPNGNVVQFFLPRNDTQAYGEANGFSAVLNNAHSRSGDVIRFENFAMSPLIREGRRTTLRATADAIAASGRFRQANLRERTSGLTDQIEAIPGVGQLHSFISDSTSAARDTIGGYTGLATGMLAP